MYKLTNKQTGEVTTVEERDIAKMFSPPSLIKIYDKIDGGEVYENETLIIGSN